MRYFPDPISGWCFVAGLLVILGIASYNDERYTKVPKWLTIPSLGVGILASILRGGWLAANGMPVWILGERGILLGALDGALFAAAGFVVGFALFFSLWSIGACGGGDVKLFAALGAWIGPYLCFLVLILSLVLLSCCLVFVLAFRVARGKRTVLAGAGRGARQGFRSPVIVRFSLVAALATILVALWAFRADLGLIPSRNAGFVAEGRFHDR